MLTRSLHGERKMIVTTRASSVDVSSTFRGGGTTCVSVELSLEDVDAKHLFYTLWEIYGAAWVTELVTREEPKAKFAASTESVQCGA